MSEQPQGHMSNYIDDNINLQDYTNINSRKQNLNNTAGNLHQLANGMLNQNSRT